MKIKKIISAIFWLGLYCLITYGYYSLRFEASGSTNVEPAENVLMHPFMSAFLMLFIGGFYELGKKVNPKHPQLAMGVLTLATIISPYWYFFIGFVWLLIYACKKVYRFILTTEWAI